MRLFDAELIHKIDRETTDVSLHGAVQMAAKNAVERCKIKIEHHLLSVNDGCVEDVEDKLGRDADGEHQQRDWNDDPLFRSQEIGKVAATLSQGAAKERLHCARKHDRRDKQTDHRHGSE